MSACCSAATRTARGASEAKELFDVSWSVCLLIETSPNRLNGWGASANTAWRVKAARSTGSIPQKCLAAAAQRASGDARARPPAHMSGRSVTVAAANDAAEVSAGNSSRPGGSFGALATARASALAADVAAADDAAETVAAAAAGESVSTNAFRISCAPPGGASNPSLPKNADIRTGPSLYDPDALCAIDSIFCAVIEAASAASAFRACRFASSSF